MQTVHSQGCTLHIQIDGPEDGPVVMFSNSLGTDLRVWDPMLPHLPKGLRIVRYDKRGHGLSECPKAPYTMDELVADAEAVANAANVKTCTFVGLSIGGLIGQGLAISRPDLVSALVLMDTAAKIGTAEMWQDRINALGDGGLEAMADAVLDRWFAPELRGNEQALTPWRNMLTRTPLEGYIGCCQAIAASDFTGDVGKISIPVMAMAGAQDQATPPELVKATADLYNAPFHLLEDAGHLPCVEKPAEAARLITAFMDKQSKI